MTDPILPIPTAPTEPAADADAAPTLPASPRDRWEQIAEIAAHGQGRVWRVRDRTGELPGFFALKELKYRKGPTSLAYRRFVREISVMAALHGTHEGIVPVMAHGIPANGDDWAPFYVMPLADDTLKRARYLAGALEEVLKIGARVADALALAHEQRVIHRDVKPANVLLFGDERRPAITDFGICHLEADDERYTHTNAQTVGSEDFVAPELRGGGARQVTASVDVYSLGKTLYEVVSGLGRTFPREDHLADEWNLARRFDDTRFEHLHGLLQRMTTEKPEARFATMAECRAAFEIALGHLRAGRAYAPGMYGGDRVPIERYARAMADLGRRTGRQQADALVALLDESERAAREAVERTTAPRLHPEYATELQPGDDAVAALAADHLLVPGAVAVALGLDDALEEWWGLVQHLALPAERHRRREQLMRDAAAAAAYALASVAWRRKRWALLAEMTKFMATNGVPFVYLAVGDDSSWASAAWLEEVIAASDVLRALEPALREDAHDALGVVSGLLLLYDLVRLSSKEVIAQLTAEPQPIHVTGFAALHPDYRAWTRLLADACRRSPATERGVAAVLGESTPETVRAEIARVTPVLARAQAQVARGLNRDTLWAAELTRAGEWARWLGLERRG